MNTRSILSPLVAVLALLTPALRAQVPQIINYQGRVAVGTTNFDGAGQFKFALVDGGTNLSSQATATATRNQITRAVDSINVTNPGSGYTSPPAVHIFGGFGHGATATASLTAGSVTSITVTNGGSVYTAAPTITIDAPPPNYTVTYWSNDGTSSVASEPAATVSLAVAKGLYSVQLGDTALTNMMAVPGSVFNNPDVRLRVWFNDGTNGSQLLTPDQRIASVGYAMVAGSVNLSATPGNNLFLGVGVGNLTTTGFENTGYGASALAQNTTGISNTASGFQALYSNTIGFVNTATGAGALYANTTGLNNTASGA